MGNPDGRSTCRRGGRHVRGHDRHLGRVVLLDVVAATVVQVVDGIVEEALDQQVDAHDVVGAAAL